MIGCFIAAVGQLKLIQFGCFSTNSSRPYSRKVRACLPNKQSVINILGNGRATVEIALSKTQGFRQANKKFKTQKVTKRGRIHTAATPVYEVPTFSVQFTIVDAAFSCFSCFCSK